MIRTVALTLCFAGAGGCFVGLAHLHFRCWYANCNRLRKVNHWCEMHARAGVADGDFDADGVPCNPVLVRFMTVRGWPLTTRGHRRKLKGKVAR